MNIAEIIQRLQDIAEYSSYDKEVNVLNLYSSVKPSQAHQVIDQGDYVVITTEERCDGEDCEECECGED